MATSEQNFDFSWHSPLVIPTSPEADFGQENEEEREPKAVLTEDRWWFSGMTKVPQSISDVIVGKLKEMPHVQAVLVGRSGEVYHVWTMIADWTVAGRRAVYAAQKELLAKLSGFELDFYVVPLDEGESPAGLVSDIPIVWQRA